MTRAAFFVVALLGAASLLHSAERDHTLDTAAGLNGADSASTNLAETSTNSFELTPADPLAEGDAAESEAPGDTLPETAQVQTNIVVVEVPGPPPPTAEELVRAAMESLAPAVETLSARLGAIEQTMSLQQQRSLEATQATTRAVLLVAGCFALAILLGVLMAALILARAVQRVSEVVVAALPPARQLPGGTGLALADSAEFAGGAPAPLEQVTSRFMGAIEKLEKRMVELEHSASSGPNQIAGRPAGGDASESGGGNGGPLEFSVSALHEKQYGGDNGPKSETGSSAVADPVHLYLGKGQALLNLGQAEDALACFERALEMNPNHADAYVKRGIALEKMEKMEAALESYDRAIAVDHSLTLAYLYKGAVCNRLQRFREALDCYENALKCEQRLAS
jgi:tetratricopeptide (TPR) repeat protein